MATEGNGDPPVPDLQTMEELCQPSLNGPGGPISPIAIQATNFGLKNDMIQQVQNSCQFHGLSGDDANKHLDKFLHVTQSIKVNGVTDNALHLDCPATVGQTQNVYAAGAYQGNSYQPQGNNHHPQGNNQGRNQFFQEASHCQNPPPAYQAPAYQAPGYQAPVHQPSIPQPQVVTTDEFTNYVKSNDAILKNMQTNMTSLTNSNLELKNMFGQFMKMNTASSLGSRTLPCNTITNPKEDLKGIANRDPDKFLIPCDFLGMDECLAPADLGASINLMPLSVWNKLSLPELSPTCMTLKLVDRLISRPVRVAKDVFVKVGTFHFPADFVVVDFDSDPRVPLILRRSFLKTRRALIDMFEGELTLRVGKKAITFNLDQTSRYSAIYIDMMANRIDIIDMTCEEYSQEVLVFFNVITSGNPTPYYDAIVSTSSPTLTPFGDSDFLLEEVNAFLALEDDPTSLEIDHSYNDPKGDILLLEVELKDLPLHLEYAFLEGDDKLPVIIVKDLSNDEKTALITVLKSHNPWVSPVHCDPKKGGFTVVENEENELIPTRLVTGWHICIDYRKLSKATRKDHFPLPFLDQMLKRLAGNEYYCFLDGFSGYFQIPIDLKDQEKTTFTCSYRMFTYRRMPFGLCNAPDTFQSSILDYPDWDLPFELMCDASDFAIGMVLRQCQEKHFRPIHYASKTMTDEESNYTTTEKVMLAVVYAFEKFRSYLILNKSIAYTDHSALKYLFPKKDSKARLLCWFLFLQEFKFNVIDTKGAENLAANHLSRLENPHQNVLDPKEINESFPLETLNMEAIDNLKACHYGPTRGHHGPNYTAKKGIDFMGPFPSSRRNKYIVVAVDYFSKWVEAKALPTNDTQVVCKFLKSLFARFGTLVPSLVITEHTSAMTSLQRKVQLNELNKLHDQANENSLIYKEKTKRLHDSKIKDRVFNIGDRVLLFNSRLKIFLGKLKTHWSGQFTITHVFPYDTVELS
nr:reverse transcriptase domain-containing protein [Tanacetum cinerariifolium]